MSETNITTTDSFEVVATPPSKETQLAAAWIPHDTAKFVVRLQQKLIEKWMNEDAICDHIIRLLTTTITTNSWEQYMDGKTNLEAVKLILQVLGMKWLGNTTNIAFFSWSPVNNWKLEY